MNPRIIKYTRGKNIVHTNPVFSRIVLIGLKRAGQEAVLFSESDERTLVSNAWRLLDEFFNSGVTRVVTWNGYKFDVPFLLARSAILGVAPTIRISTYPWNMENSNHFDCLKFLSGNEQLGWNTLEVTCLQLGIDAPENYIWGGHIDNLFRQGKIDEIREHNMQDLRMTEELFERIRQVIEQQVEEPATQKQKDYLASRGKTVPPKLSKNEASRMIDEVMHPK